MLMMKLTYQYQWSRCTALKIYSNKTYYIQYILYYDELVMQHFYMVNSLSK